MSLLAIINTAGKRSVSISGLTHTLTPIKIPQYKPGKRTSHKITKRKSGSITLNMVSIPDTEAQTKCHSKRNNKENQIADSLSPVELMTLRMHIELINKQIPPRIKTHVKGSNPKKCPTLINTVHKGAVDPDEAIPGINDHPYPRLRFRAYV
jgi:hypothetical protein